MNSVVRVSVLAVTLPGLCGLTGCGASGQPTTATETTSVAPETPAAKKPMAATGTPVQHTRYIALSGYRMNHGAIELVAHDGDITSGGGEQALFDTVGSPWSPRLDGKAAITVTAPLGDGEESSPVGVAVFLEALKKHAAKMPVFTYHLNADGWIDRLDEVFMP